ncbi:phage protein [Acetobacterium woodii DSM 1030]|uniref:Phage protein n=2 Tax=Acetobacterium woodii TaxID=33952 RepID=H6LI97_ACEWD|nr:phage protein [Acetobacterium woodii DSM 1030]
MEVEMAFTDVFKGKQFKNESENLKVLLAEALEDKKRLESMLSPEMSNLEKLRSIIIDLEHQRDGLQNDINKLAVEKSQIQKNINELNKQVEAKKVDLIQLDDEILYQSFGIYTPIYNLMSSEEYKDRINKNRIRQKHLIKMDLAATYTKTMTLDGNLKKGQKMVSDTVKHAIRSFNNECDAAISGVKFNNIEIIKKRIQKSKEAIEKLNKALSIRITNDYSDCKIEELNLCYEYAVKKQEEKEVAKAEREALREEAKLQKELEEARKHILKEQSHYKNALQKIDEQIQASGLNDDLRAKRQEISDKLTNIETSIKDIDYREANKRAGYVYVISNIGSFGENVFKIGMTRRLEPLDRINELGDASVPFNFDLHAMIFSDDAPKLENALHQAFEHKKVNMINQRREFFNVTLEEIETVIKKNFDKTVDIIKTPQAEQFRESQMIKKNITTNSVIN